MKEKLLLCTVLFFTIASILFSQEFGVSQKQLDTIKNALQRIALSNNAVENIIYDGMTYGEVISILNVQSIEITYQSSFYPLEYVYNSSVGKYVIFWSSRNTKANPIVIGYSMRGDKKIYHRYLQ